MMFKKEAYMPVSAISSITNQYDTSFLGKTKNADKPVVSLGHNAKKGEDPSQDKDVEKLKKRDAEVRAHEQAHVAAGGAYIKGGVSYQYQKGSDGKMYAVGGEVSIDTSPIKGNPQATIAKMEVVKQAANAPADPSGADRSVAAAADQAEAQARREIAKKPSSSNKSVETEVIPSSGSDNLKKTATQYTPLGQKSAQTDSISSILDLIA